MFFFFALFLYQIYFKVQIQRRAHNFRLVDPNLSNSTFCLQENEKEQLKLQKKTHVTFTVTYEKKNFHAQTSDQLRKKAFRVIASYPNNLLQILL